MMSLPAMSLGVRLCVSRKAGQGEVGGCTRRMQNSMAVSGLVFRSDLVGTGEGHFYPFRHKWS